MEVRLLGFKLMPMLGGAAFGLGARRLGLGLRKTESSETQASRLDEGLCILDTWQLYIEAGAEALGQLDGAMSNLHAGNKFFSHSSH